MFAVNTSYEEFQLVRNIMNFNCNHYHNSLIQIRLFLFCDGGYSDTDPFLL